tara:strand:- start:356 stop:721 length:366 start_codon:yes stop_codon:yes gene_type:complete
MDIFTYVDSIGRTCFGELVEQTDDFLRIKAPAMIMVTPNDAANMKVDVMPLFFTEFSSGEHPIFKYKSNQYTEVEVNISEKILIHYNAKINTTEEPNVEPPATPLSEENVPEVTLFEDTTN